MAVTPQVRGSEAVTNVVYGGSTQLRVPEFTSLVVYNIPAQQLRAGEVTTLVTYSGTLSNKVSEVTVLVVYGGRIDTPKLRRWGFVLDGHTFIGTRLGSYLKTLVYDLSTNTYSWWQSGEGNDFPVNTVINWVASGTIATNYGSNVIAGDANNGNLYILDPEYGLDASSTGVFPFNRIATAQIPTESRVKPPVYQVYLTASLGKPAWDGASVTLSYSDDQGNSYNVASSKTVTVGDYEQEFAWRSLGLAGSRRNMGSPGRLLQIEDDGAFARIDSLDIL